MYTRLTEAGEVIAALRDHTRSLHLGKASPPSEGGGPGPRGNDMSSRPASGKGKHVHQTSDLETVYPVTVRETLPKQDKISHTCGGVSSDTCNIQVKVLSGKFERGAGYCPRQLVLQERKAHDNELSVLLAERHVHK